MDAEATGPGTSPRVIEPPKAKRAKVRVPTPVELAAIVAKLPDRWRAFVVLGAYPSLRWSELVALKRDDLDIETRTLQVDEKIVEVRGAVRRVSPKIIESERVVILSEVVIPPLAEHLLRFPPSRTSDARLEGVIFYGEHRGLVRRHVFRPVWSGPVALRD